MQSDAQQMQGVGVVGLGVEDAAISPDGLGQQSALVFLQTEGKLVVHGNALSISKRGTRRDGGHGNFLDENGITCITIREQ
jgi:hypothetical protein